MGRYEDWELHWKIEVQIQMNRVVCIIRPPASFAAAGSPVVQANERLQTGNVFISGLFLYCQFAGYNVSVHFQFKNINTSRVAANLRILQVIDTRMQVC